jgi:hypothetical protein
MMLTRTKLKKRESTCANARQKAVDVERSKAPADRVPLRGVGAAASA